MLAALPGFDNTIVDPTQIVYARIVPVRVRKPGMKKRSDMWKVEVQSWTNGDFYIPQWTKRFDTELEAQKVLADIRDFTNNLVPQNRPPMRPAASCPVPRQVPSAGV